MLSKALKRTRTLSAIEHQSAVRMADLTTFRIGGTVDSMYVPKNTEEVSSLVRYFKESSQDFFVLGNGSNLLIPDTGLSITVMKIGSEMGYCSVQKSDYTIQAEAGISLKRLANLALENEMTGLEFAHGIPGNLGGAVFMNAGAYDREMSHVVEWVDVVDQEGEVQRIPVEDMQFGYRTSAVKTNGWIVVRVGLRLRPGDPSMIRESMEELAEKRRSRQPLEYPSAGSVFKRPQGHFAGKLIDDAGLKGARIGGAMVSEKHAGFIINYDKATYDDVCALIAMVQAKVKEMYGIELEPEISILKGI